MGWFLLAGMVGLNSIAHKNRKAKLRQELVEHLECQNYLGTEYGDAVLDHFDRHHDHPDYEFGETSFPKKAQLTKTKR